MIYKVEFIAALGVIRESGCAHINLARLHGGQDHGEVLFHGLEIESQDAGNGVRKIEFNALERPVGILKLKWGIGWVSSGSEDAIVVVIHGGNFRHHCGMGFFPAVRRGIFLVGDAGTQAQRGD